MSHSLATNFSDRDPDLWHSFRQGNRSALDKIYQDLIRPLYSYGFKLTQNKGLVEDCIQDMFVELWERRENLGATDSIKFYLFKVLRRTILSRLSQSKYHFGDGRFLKDGLSEESAEFKLVVAQAVAQKRVALQKAIEQLSSRQKEVIFLRFYDELEFEEIAQMMGIEVKSVYKLTYKAFASLKKYLAPKSILLHTVLLLFLLLFSV